MITPMCLIQIVGLKENLETVIEELHQLKMIHLVPITAKDGSGLQAMQLEPEEEEERTQVQQNLLELHGLMDTLGISTHKPATKRFSGNLVDLQDQYTVFAETVQSVLKEKQTLLETRNLLPVYEKKIKQLIPLLPETAYSPDYAVVGLFISKIQKDVFEYLQTYLKELSEDRIEIVGKDVDRETTVLMVVTPVQYIPEIETYLGDENIPRMQLPDQFQRKNPNETLKAVQNQLTVLPEKIKECDRQLQRLREEYAEKVVSWFGFLQSRYDFYSIRNQLAETNYTFILQGWIPEERYSELSQKLSAIFGDRLVILKSPKNSWGNLQPPVLMKNPAWIQPFENPVKLFALPRYSDLDPTGLMSFFLPLFFGMILGDIGYGALLLLLSQILILRSKKGILKALAKIMRFGAFWAIIFGFLYGELFGTLGEKIGLHPIWIDRTKEDALLPLIIASIAMGVIHIVLGLILGIWQAFLTRSRNHLLERSGMLIGLFGLFFLAAVLAEFLPGSLRIPSIVLLITGIVILGFSIGKAGVIVGPLEFLGLIGNILSYIRLAAVGLASVYLAKVANELGGVLGSILIGLIVAVLFHALNLVIGAFSPSIHSLRLMYVEFFRKFYEGGGSNYQPFGKPFEPTIDRYNP